jgi:hypothetical protein
MRKLCACILKRQKLRTEMPSKRIFKIKAIDEKAKN